MTFQSRDYQVGAHDAILKAWGVPGYRDMDLEAVHATMIENMGKNPFAGLSGMEAPCKSALLNICTSAGKTIITAKVIETLVNSGKRCAFVADSDELCMQPLEKLRKATGIIASLEKADSKASLHAEVVVGSLQTLRRAKRRERFSPDHFDFIIYDEAHRSSDAAQEITEYFTGARKGGLTATAFRAKLKDLSKWYERVAFELGTFDLVGQGYITPPSVLTIPINIDLTKVKQSRVGGETDFDATDLSTTIEPYYSEIARLVKLNAPTHQILGFHPLIASSKAFTEICHREGMSAVHCDGTCDDRDAVIQAFENREHQVLNNSQLFSTGVDFQQCDCILILRPTQSAGAFRQMVGRGLRIPPGVIDGLNTAEERKAAIAASAKPTCLILDFLWQTEKLGLQGPACLIANDADDFAEVTKKLREKRTPEQLADIMRMVQEDREMKLRKALERVNKRRGALMDARMVGIILHQPELASFEAVSPWQEKPVNEYQRKALETRGIDVESVKNAGHAAVMLEAVAGRAKKGMAPLYAFEALKERGVTNPEVLSLDDAIRKLGDTFPLGFGKAHRGKAFRAIPEGFWDWLWEQYDKPWLDSFPAEKRYCAHVQRRKLAAV